ncbi:hypothetical protein KMC60_gp79 [Achromobacter phage vB_AxyP_19-32_Axy11]|uniref:Uncharacterized protein n=1 Tax=Achromobacter phage vB_AxyP_19-32_Axy11 TaxID=2591042 RepID=A0A514CUA6_9CAUD|nr:hypothetical protein KMC60_gp79 [Achromobacter phage vB_AxyP_19-32_Axy11]QDH84053.1 hypothetical protein Axy11_036 [Achromobacter phage vB_AxyP_19-32_Axy11]
MFPDFAGLEARILLDLATKGSSTSMVYMTNEGIARQILEMHDLFDEPSSIERKAHDLIDELWNKENIEIWVDDFVSIPEPKPKKKGLPWFHHRRRW